MAARKGPREASERRVDAVIRLPDRRIRQAENPRWRVRFSVDGRLDDDGARAQALNVCAAHPNRGQRTGLDEIFECFELHTFSMPEALLRARSLCADSSSFPCIWRQQLHWISDSCQLRRRE